MFIIFDSSPTILTFPFHYLKFNRFFFDIFDKCHTQIIFDSCLFFFDSFTSGWILATRVFLDNIWQLFLAFNIQLFFSLTRFIELTLSAYWVSKVSSIYVIRMRASHFSSFWQFSFDLPIIFDSSFLWLTFIWFFLWIFKTFLEYLTAHS